MIIGKKDIKVNIKFEADEFELLQDNTYQMADSFGLDRRIEKLSGKKEIGFYSWDLDCLECIVSDLINDPKDHEIAVRIAKKIESGYKFIEQKQVEVKCLIF